MANDKEVKECCYIMTQCFERINLFRSVHGADSVTLDADLCEKADKWAKELAEKDGLEHSPRDYRENEGENLSGFTGNQPIISSIDRWYAEEKDYDYKTAKFAGNIGHFTQIVWKDSKKFGISWAKSSSGWTYVVARFSPPGNVIITPPGEEECFRKNVQKPDRTLQKTFQTMKITREVHEPKKFEPVTSSHRVAFVKKINEIRKDHKVNPLTEEKDLNKSAQKWADSMAKNDKAENGPGDDMGECLYSYSGPNFQLNSALTAWYGGCEKYNFRKPGWQQGCGNFTQLVWAETTTVGVGAAESKSGKIYVCARFQPPGNMIITPPGEEATFIKNVFSN